MGKIMKKLIKIMSILLVISTYTFSQNENKPDFNIRDWFQEDSIKIRIGIGENIIQENHEDYGEFKLIGWSKNGLIAYMFFPMTSVACETEDYFYIYDLKNNKEIWYKFACSVDWTDPDNKTVNEIINKLNEYDFYPGNNQRLNSIETKIEKKDSIINLYQIRSNENILMHSLNIKERYYNIIQSDGYLISPFDENLYAILFGYYQDIENVYILGFRNE